MGRALVAAALALALAVLAGTADGAGRRPQGYVRAVVQLRQQASLEGLHWPGRALRVESVVRALRRTADGAQAPVLAWLAARPDGEVRHVTRLWVSDALVVGARPSVLEALARRPDVASVTPEASFRAPPAPAGSPFAAATAVAPNLDVIGAPRVWASGDTGQGIVIAALDTGVDLSDPDLASAFEPAAGWFDPYGQHAAPFDASGHGTWVAGVLVGRDATGQSIGVAPGARLIAAKVFRDDGTATATAIHQAFQWVLDPDGDPATGADVPQVVNASFGAPALGCDTSFAPDVAALRAAGILPVFAAGNAGPGGPSDETPANLPGTLAVGASGDDDTLAPDSSRGPSRCPLKTSYPDLVAPGVGVPTVDLHGLAAAVSGTSLAAPQVAGALALLLSARPGLTADEQAGALACGAVDLGPAGDDPAFGLGRLDVAASLQGLVAGRDCSGPSLAGVSLPAATSAPALTVSAAAHDAAGVAAVEAFVDRLGPPGSGIALSAADGAFGGADEAVAGSVPLAGLADGAHLLLLRGRDTGGIPGTPASAPFSIDRTPPRVSGLTAAPSPTDGAATVVLHAAAGDAASAIDAAEWIDGSDPGAGHGSPLAALDGAFDAPTEELAGTLDVRSFAVGTHHLQVRARDAVGNWSAPTAIDVVVEAPDAVLADGFESGSLRAWSRHAGRVRARRAARLHGRYGLLVTAGRAPAYVEDASPLSEPRLNARFVLDARQLRAPGALPILALRDGRGAGVATVQLRARDPRHAWLREGARSDASMRYGAWRVLPPGPHTIELDWASGERGVAILRLDGRVAAGLSLRNGPIRIESVRLGALGRANGTLLVDDYAASRRTRQALVRDPAAS